MNATPLVSLRACFCSPERRHPDSQQLPALGYTLQHRLPPVCGLRRRNQRLRGGAITGLQHLRHTGRQDISCRGVMCAVGTLSTHTAAQPRQGRTTAILICHNRSADGFPAFFSDYVVIRAKALLQLPARTACPWRHPDALHEAARLKGDGRQEAKSQQGGAAGTWLQRAIRGGPRGHPSGWPGQPQGAVQRHQPLCRHGQPLVKAVRRHEQPAPGSMWVTKQDVL